MNATSGAHRRLEPAHFYCPGAVDRDIVFSTFVTAVRSVGCAATLAAAGLWFARRGLMTPALSKGLSQLSVKLAIPALLFSSMVPGASAELIEYAWPLLFLPAVYLLLGMVIGLLLLVVVQPPSDFRLGTVAACAFGNTTGIPVVLLSVLQQSLSHSVFADIADPLLFLSLMLVTMPLVQWLVGLVLLALVGPHDQSVAAGDACCEALRCFGLCSCCREHDGGEATRDELFAELDLALDLVPAAAAGAAGSLEQELLHAPPAEPARPIRRHGPGEESSSYISMMSQGEDDIVPYEAMGLQPAHTVGQLGSLHGSLGSSMADRLYALVPGERTRKRVARGCWRATGQLLRRVFVPQIVSIVAGGLVGLFGRPFVLPPETAPLGWLYLGVTKLGAAAVPINLILLGAALSRTPHRGQLPPLTAAGIIVARMVAMPLCGLGVARLLSGLHLSIPYMVADPFWLVCLILTCTPTANNSVVMCDAAGENRRAMSAAIFYQYCAAPLILPWVLTLFITFICRTRHEYHADDSALMGDAP